MGCASSAPFVPTNGSNGAVVSPDAPPYELKTAADEDLLKPPEPAHSSIAGKVMNSVSGLADSEPVHHIMDNASQMKDDTLHKINDIGESVKDKIDDIVDEVENKIQSAFGRSNSVASNGMQEAKEALNDMKAATKESVTNAKESLNDTLEDMVDDIDKDVDTMVEDLEETLPRAPTPAPIQRDTNSPLDKDGTQYCSISPDEILTDSNLKQFSEDCLNEIKMIRKEIFLNSNIMCDMLLLKGESMDMFMYPTLETLTEISEDGVSNGIKTPRSVLVLNEDIHNKSQIFENFSSITTPIDSLSVISFQMNGEHQTPSQSSGKSQNVTIQQNGNNGAFHCLPDETKAPDSANQVESTKLMNLQENVELNNGHKVKIECDEQTQNDFSLKPETLQKNSLPGNDETTIVKQILRSPSEAPSYYTSDSQKSPSVSTVLHGKLIVNGIDDELPQQNNSKIYIINGHSDNYQLSQNSPESGDMLQRNVSSLESNEISLNSTMSTRGAVEIAEQNSNTEDALLRSASPSAPSLTVELSGNSAPTNTPTSPVVMKTISPAASPHPFSASVKHNEEEVAYLHPTSAQSNISVISKKCNISNSEIVSQKSTKSRSSSAKSINTETIPEKSIKSAPASAKSNKSGSSNKFVNSPSSAEKTRCSHSVHTEAQIDDNMMNYQNTINNQQADNESSEISDREKILSPIRIASSLIATPGSKTDSAISSPVSTPDSCMQELIISS